ncbi:hypothetical protein UT300005_07070 [Clostridium sp. CTA-5]
MKNKTSIVLYGYELMCEENLNIDIVITNRKASIVKGIIYNEKHEPAVGAVIETKEFNPYIKKYRILGYFFTNNKGEYAFLLRPIYGMYYEFSIYSPLYSL